MKYLNIKKKNNRYENIRKLYKQFIYISLYIAEILYPKYLLLFCLNNITSYFTYVKDEFLVQKINKGNKNILT